MAKEERKMFAPIEEMSKPRNLTYEQVYNRVLELFFHDRDKANAWWMSRNQHLDNKAPYEMIKEGKARKLVRFLQRCGI